jgi:trigger factor
MKDHEMQLVETLKEGLKRGYTIKLTAAELDAKVNEKLAEAQPDIEMKGFRKGKVPMALLKKQFGPKVMGEAMQEAIDGAVSKHFDETGERPALQPQMKMASEDWKQGDDVEVEMNYEALPEIPEVDLAAVKLERLNVKADDAAVTEALDKLAEGAQSFDDRKKGSKAKSGDQVVIDFVGKVGGEAFDGGTAQDYALVLGSNSFIPGFEDGLVGVKAGEERDVTVTFPEDYRATALAGKEAVFSVTVKAVKEPKKAEIDDELAKKYGAEDLAGLKTQLTERLETEYRTAARAVMKRGLLDALDKSVSFDLPPSLVEAEAGQIAHQLWHEEHHDHSGHDHGEIAATDDHKRLAERRVRLGLLLAEIGRKQEIKVTEQEMTQAVLAQARQYRGQERAFFDYVQKNAAARQQIQAPIFEDKVVDYIFGIAKVSEKDVGKDDLQKAVDALDEE